MTAVNVQLQLPDGLAEEARKRGLLSADAIESLLRRELRRQQSGELFRIADELGDSNVPPMTEAEIDAEIRAARAG